MARISLEPWPLHARCPGCGEVASHKALRVDANGTRHLRCKACGHEWERERGKARVAATSEAERRRPRAEREVRTCPWCGREFVPRRDAVWCSDACRDRGRRHHRSAIAGLMAQTARLERRMREVT